MIVLDWKVPTFRPVQSFDPIHKNCFKILDLLILLFTGNGAKMFSSSEILRKSIDAGKPTVTLSYLQAYSDQCCCWITKDWVGLLPTSWTFLCNRAVIINPHWCLVTRTILCSHVYSVKSRDIFVLFLSQECALRRWQSYRQKN